MSAADPPFAKIGFGYKQLEHLEAGIRTFLKGGAYQAVPYFDPHRPGIPVVGRVLAEPPVDYWGAIIGSIVNSVRSALDNLVWELSEQISDPVPDPEPKDWREVAFPIVLDPKDWGSARGSKLSKVEGLAADFEALQPFRTGPDDPEGETLAIIQELWIRDKHRRIALTQTYVSLEDAVSRTVESFDGPVPYVLFGPGGYCADCDPSHDHPLNNIIERGVRESPLNIVYEVVESRPPGPFEDGAELGLIEPRLERGDYIVGAAHMDVDPILAFDVAFEQGPPAYGKPVIDTLRDALEIANRIIATFLA